MKLRNLAPIAAALLLAACQSAPPPPRVAAQPRYTGPAQGIDLPTDASDALNEIRDSKLDFVARYYRSPISRWPTLTAAEAQRLSGLGVNIVAVWESHSHDPAYFTYQTGYSDALTAYAQAKGIGQPAGSAIYFAVDYNARGSDIAGPIQQYFRGVSAGLAAAGGGRSEYRVGVYGSGAVCDAMKRAGLAQYAWLTGSVAWAGTMNYQDWNIRQGGHFSVLSFNHDSDEAKGDYGGFRTAGAGTVPTFAAAPAVAAVAPAPVAAANAPAAVSAPAAPVVAADAAPATVAAAQPAAQDVAGPVEIVVPEAPHEGTWATIAAMFSL